MGKWSGGIKHTEKSILNVICCLILINLKFNILSLPKAYIELIESAEHYIYIEVKSLSNIGYFVF